MRLASSAVVACVLLSVSAAAQPPSPEAVIASTPQYDLAIRVVPEAHRLEVSGTLRLPAATAARPAIEFDLAKSMKDLQAEILEPAESAGKVEVSQRPDEDSVHYTLRPRKPIPANRPAAIRFSYAGGEQTSLVFYIGPEGSFAGGPDTAWYPQFSDQHGRGRGRMTFTVPAGYTVLASGRRLSSAADGAKGAFVFEQKVPDQLSFAAARYTVLKRDGVVPMRAYLLHPHPDAERYLDGASKALAVLTEEFGPYPYDEFAIAEVPNDKAEQAGFAGASMAGFMLADTADLDEPFNLAYYAHEIGHQWWGNLVTQTGARGASILNEGLAQFGSLQAVETLEGETKAEQYRRDGYPGYNPQQCGVGYLMLSESGLDHRLLDLPRSLVSHTLADSKGFLVLDALSRTIGRENFRKALHAITSDFAFRSIAWEDFVGAVQRASGQDLGWFWEQWFGRTGAPDWQLAWKQDAAGLHVSITQPEPLYRAEIQVEAKGVNYETASRQVRLEGAQTEFTWAISFRAASVELDPHFLVLHWLPGLRAKAQARGPAFRASYLREDGKLDEAEAILRDALAHLPQPDPYGAQFVDEYETARLLMKKKSWRDAAAHFDAALAAPSRDPEVLPWLFYHYAEVAQALHDDAKLRWAVDGAASADAALRASSGAAGMARTLLNGKQ